VVALAGGPGGYWLATGSPTVAAPADLGPFTVTCYSLAGHTATGAPTSTDVVAVDPAVIPLGSRLVIEGVGRRVASDTGGAIRGHRVDVWQPSAADCAAFGVRRLEVWRPAA
jgi:3D (Asp-Asp-Asp) domain-containing protein